MNLDLIAATSSITGRVELFGIGPGGAIYHNSWAGNALMFTAWDSLGTPVLGKPFVTVPSAVSSSPGRLDVVAVAADNQMYYCSGILQGNGSVQWSFWEQLGSPGVLGSPPVVGQPAGFSNAPVMVSWGPARLDVFGIGMDNQLYHLASQDYVWQAGWEGLGSLNGAAGLWNSPPAIACWGPGRIDIFAQGADHSMYHKSWDDQHGWLPGPGITGWESHIPGHFYSPPTAVSWGPQRVDVFALGVDLSMQHIGFTGTAWLPGFNWEALGGGFFSKPTTVSRGPNLLDVFAVGLDGQLYHNWFTAPPDAPLTAGTWVSLGGQFLSPPVAVVSGPNSVDIFGLGLDMKMYHRSLTDDGWAPPLSESWDFLGGPLGTGFSKPMPSSAPPFRLDFDTGWISLPGGDAVGGPAHVTLFSNGNTVFSGQFRDSGAFSYSYSVVVGIVDAQGNTYSFQRQGTVTTQDRNDPWNTPSFNAEIALNWPALAEGSFLGYEAATNLSDAGSILADIWRILAAPLGAIFVGPMGGHPGAPQPNFAGTPYIPLSGGG